MKFIIIALLIFTFLKSFYYSLYEIKEKKNKPAGITIIFLAILGLIFPIGLLFIIYWL